MKWTKWDVLIHLGRDTYCAAQSNEAPRCLGVTSARSVHEAEQKGIKKAKSRGLSGLIEVRPVEV